jgi:hypothetical protein
LLVVAGAAITLGGLGWMEVAVFAALAAGTVTIALFSVAAPSTSRSCRNAEQPLSSGNYDCDTGFGLGLPIIAVGLFVPVFALSGAATITASALRRGRRGTPSGALDRR